MAVEVTRNGGDATNNVHKGIPQRRFIAGSTSIGSPPLSSTALLLPDIEVIRYKIHDFPNRKEKRGEYFETKAVIAHGYPWKLRVFPLNKRHISLFVRYAGDDPEFLPNTKKCTSVDENSGTINGAPIHSNIRPHVGGGVTARANFVCKNHKKVGEIRKYHRDNDWGFEEYLERDLVLGVETNPNFLEKDGTLIIDVELQVCVKGPWRRGKGGFCRGSVWYPKESIAMLQNCSEMDTYGDRDDAYDSSGSTTNNLAELLFTLDEFVDATFLVAGVEFRTHKCVLAVKCRTLLDMVLDHEESLGDDGSCSSTNRRGSWETIQLDNVEPRVFQTLLEYVYGVRKNGLIAATATNTAEGNREFFKNEHEDEEYARALLLAGNRFGCPQLKLYAESVLVDKHLTLENAPEYLPLADSHSCALLKEASMDLIASTPDAAMKSKHWPLVEDSSRLMTELLLHYNQFNILSRDEYDQKSNMQREDNNHCSAFYNGMDVTTLRRRLEDCHLSCDGSREVLIHRLIRHEEELERRVAEGKDTQSAITRQKPGNVPTWREVQLDSQIR
jgi:hypothetical protein